MNFPEPGMQLVLSVLALRSAAMPSPRHLNGLICRLDWVRSAKSRYSIMQDAPVPGSAQRRKTQSKQGIATVQATALAPESGPEYDLLNDEKKPSFGFLKGTRKDSGHPITHTNSPRMFGVYSITTNDSAA